ncbi:very short patch repair endonuclease [Acuticoccus kandeliae]|uniref:very short patch repair endonuclease n=1 Tax=Acuticoccus kandeliae TaxID=2073160 RepID=UPI002481B621|nr:DNA mismatch endonuclease Vsr [Acuticoccus kandeliae]
MKPETPPNTARSALMARVRQRGTKPELVVSELLRRIGCRYRLNVRTLPGSPDFANKARRWAVFVNGCFWHHHKACRRATIPGANRPFWLEKFASNRRRDAAAARALRRLGFRVVVVWECETADPGPLFTRLSEILKPSGDRIREPVDH